MWGGRTPNPYAAVNCNDEQAVSVDRRTLEDRFVPRSQLGSIQGNEKHTTVGFQLGRFMFADNSQIPGLVPVLPATGLVEVREPGFANPERQATMSELVPYFLGYGKVERNWSDTTLRTYGNSLRWIIRIIGTSRPNAFGWNTCSG